MESKAIDGVTGLEHVGLRDRVLALRSMEPLAPLDLDALTLIAEHTRPRSWRRGQVIYREGEPITEVQIVLAGLIRVSRHGAHLIDVEPGFGAGFLSVLANDPNGVDAVAAQPTRSLGLPVEVLLDSFEQNFSLLRNGIRLSARSALALRGNLPTATRDENADPGEFPQRSPTFVERVIEIRRDPNFRDANVDAAIELVRRSREVRGKAGDLIYDIGDQSDYWINIRYGRLRATAASGESTTVGADFSLGVFEALAAVPRTMRVVAETDYIYYRTELETMLGIFEAHFKLASGLLTGLSMMLMRSQSPTLAPTSDNSSEAQETKT